MSSKLAILCLGVVLLGAVGCKGAFVERSVYDNDIAQLKDYIAALERDNSEMTGKVTRFDRLKTQTDIHGTSNRNLESLAASLKKALAGMGIPEADVRYIKETNSFSMESGVLFSSGGFTISSQGKQILSTLASKLGGQDLKIVGHTDKRRISSSRVRNSLETDTNLELSMKRAAAVMGQLLKSGIPESAMFVVGRGATQTLGGPNKNDRRVEIFLAGKDESTSRK